MNILDFESYHKPVLLEEVLHYLAPRPGKNYIDATLGGGGHSEKILDTIEPDGHLIGFDQDPEAIAFAEKRLSKFKNRLHVIRANFRNIDLAKKLNLPIAGILLDIGVSSHQLDEAERGFSFLQDGPLDMRMNPALSLTAAEILRNCGESELTRIFQEYGEERYAKKMARAIKNHLASGKPLERTTELARLIEQCIPRSGSKIHPATRIFQALRIEVNQELKSLTEAIDKGFSLLEPQGRLVIISFHSLEDRIVKTKFREIEKGCICPPDLPRCVCGLKPMGKILTAKPVTASPAEEKANPRSRSAKLRAIEKF